MVHADVHPELEVLASRAWLSFGLEEDALVAARQGAEQGCSRCARALVNAGDVATDLGFAHASAPPSSSGLRERILADAAARRASLSAPARAPTALQPRHPLEPSAAVARHHAVAPGEAERTREVDELAALSPPEGDRCEALLAQLGRLIDFPILFVSIVRGERVGYRAQRGLDPALAEFRAIRREMSYCTHTVDSDGPFVVEDAAAEPFFRASRMVRRYGIRAYAGVPLRSRRGVVIGTVCALDPSPRAIAAEVVETLSLFTEPVIAEIEGPRDGEPSDARGLASPGWFRRLLAIEQRASLQRARPSWLLVLPGSATPRLLALAREDEVAASLSPSSCALLLAALEPAQAEARAADLRASLGEQGLPDEAPLLLPAGAFASGEDWASAALRASLRR
jgi:hypothetical protein